MTICIIDYYSSLLLEYIMDFCLINSLLLYMNKNKHFQQILKILERSLVKNNNLIKVKAQAWNVQ